MMNHPDRCFLMLALFALGCSPKPDVRSFMTFTVQKQFPLTRDGELKIYGVLHPHAGDEALFDPRIVVKLATQDGSVTTEGRATLIDTHDGKLGFICHFQVRDLPFETGRVHIHAVCLKSGKPIRAEGSFPYERPVGLFNRPGG